MQIGNHRARLVDNETLGKRNPKRCFLAARGHRDHNGGAQSYLGFFGWGQQSLFKRPFQAAKPRTDCVVTEPVIGAQFLERSPHTSKINLPKMRFGKRPLNGPAGRNAANRPAVINSETSADFFERPLGASKENLSRSAAGVVLGAPCLPLAIFRLVISVCVNASKGQPSGTRPHIGKEIREALPARANLNAATAVVLPVFICFATATAMHPGPNSIGAGVVLLASVTMFVVAVIGSVFRYFGRHSVANPMLC